MRKLFGLCCRPLTAFACAIVAIAMFVAPETISAKSNKKIGIQLYSVMDAVNKNPKASVERLAGMGYNVFELVQWGGDAKVFGLPAEEFKALCDKNGVKIISTHSGIQEDASKEAEIMQRWRQLFEIQKACGGKYFVIPSYGVDYTVKDVQRMCDYFNRVGKIASEYGLKLGYHNHSGEFNKLKDSDKVMWEYLVENTNPKYVCFELDVYWCTKGNKNPVEYLKKYPKRIKLLHIKDDFVIGASGTIDFEGIFNQFYKNGMKDYVVEIETPGYLREKKNADGSKYTQDQIMEEVFKAARESSEYLNNAKFVKK
ncbi:sugar phosphate isomerase/epimerase [Parabacteroides sp. AM08-6]|uniref:sugar phosphate isomerase/epimerase family protein n=1 Tax=Parabacteroides sp. AM08-6 TaxID=2292053 RepID=UPI000EFF5951|nr:sugar phosphate isomerase/epimerase [Parabacteroides sp. AM08-6]RHJ86503.1 sugar phosphate isomerase/epimerase [Parabacteroides sp. AM08-6]